jgi:hypothetical protein
MGKPMWPVWVGIVLIIVFGVVAAYSAPLGYPQKWWEKYATMVEILSLIIFVHVI